MPSCVKGKERRLCGVPLKNGSELISVVYSRPIHIKLRRSSDITNSTTYNVRRLLGPLDIITPSNYE